MKKVYGKLAAAVVAILVALSMVVVSTYAWMTMSTSPVATGIQIAISGGNTILLAPDISTQVNGVVCHYPGTFNDNLVLSRNEGYSYLSNLYGLLPVSTVDGQNWVVPAYYSASDTQVQAGLATAGTIKPVSQFEVDSTLQYANLRELPSDVRSQGAYVYVDFWVVSPGADYTLRISAGGMDDSGTSQQSKQGEGSFVIGLPQPQKLEEGYSLVEEDASCAYSARIGFLINQDTVSQQTAQCYYSSADYNDRYSQLLGQYQEKGEDASTFPYAQGRFIIYEPNADRHLSEENDGSYSVTRPLAWRNGSVVESSILADHLVVQLQSGWNDQGITLEEAFQTCFAGKDSENMTTEELSQTFYGDYLQNQVAYYVNPGKMIANTQNLYTYASGNAGIVEPNVLNSMDTVRAAKDGFLVHLERNMPQRIRMFIWLEGQDADCRNGIALSNFAVAITLAGSNVNDE